MGNGGEPFPRALKMSIPEGDLGDPMCLEKEPFLKYSGSNMWLFRFWRGSPWAPESLTPGSLKNLLFDFFVKLGHFRKKIMGQIR